MAPTLGIYRVYRVPSKGIVKAVTSYQLSMTDVQSMSPVLSTTHVDRSYVAKDKIRRRTKAGAHTSIGNVSQTPQ